MNMIAENVRPARWIIELDYDADPDTAPETIRQDIADQMMAAKGTPIVEEDRIIFDHSEDAFGARLRYGANVMRVIPEYA
jgi:hypothetical protein